MDEESLKAAESYRDIVILWWRWFYSICKFCCCCHCIHISTV